jgi:hypothetical protein
VRFATQRGILDQVVLPVGIAKKRRRHRNHFARRAGVKPGAGVAPRVQAVGQDDREGHRIVGQHLLHNRGDAIEQIVQLTGIGQRRQQLVEKLEVRGPRPQLLVRGGRFGVPRVIAEIVDDAELPRLGQQLGLGAAAPRRMAERR